MSNFVQTLFKLSERMQQRMSLFEPKPEGVIERSGRWHTAGQTKDFEQVCWITFSGRSIGSTNSVGVLVDWYSRPTLEAPLCCHFICCFTCLHSVLGRRKNRMKQKKLKMTDTHLGRSALKMDQSSIKSTFAWMHDRLYLSHFCSSAGMKDDFFFCADDFKPFHEQTIDAPSLWSSRMGFVPSAALLVVPDNRGAASLLHQLTGRHD